MAAAMQTPWALGLALAARGGLTDVCPFDRHTQQWHEFMEGFASWGDKREGAGDEHS